MDFEERRWSYNPFFRKYLERECNTFKKDFPKDWSGLEVNISKGLSINDVTFGRKGGEPKVTKSDGGRGV